MRAIDDLLRNELKQEHRTELLVLLACDGSLPTADLGGRLRGAGLIDKRGLLTDLGREIARELLTEGA